MFFVWIRLERLLRENDRRKLAPLTDHYSLDTIQQILATYIQTSEDTNSTAQAIRKEYGDLEHHYKASHIIPFSSDRKWGQ